MLVQKTKLKPQATKRQDLTSLNWLSICTKNSAWCIAVFFHDALLMTPSLRGRVFGEDRCIKGYF